MGPGGGPRRVRPPPADGGGLVRPRRAPQHSPRYPVAPLVPAWNDAARRTHHAPLARIVRRRAEGAARAPAPQVRRGLRAARTPRPAPSVVVVPGPGATRPADRARRAARRATLRARGPAPACLVDPRRRARVRGRPLDSRPPALRLAARGLPARRGARRGGAHAVPEARPRRPWAG